MANDLRYPSTKLVEDRCFCERCFYWIKSYKAIDKCIFTYWFNSNSIVHTSDGEMFFTENYKGFSMNKKYFNNLDVEYDIEYSVCMLFCSYIKSLCCQYSFKQVEAKVEKDERLRPIRH